jgi:serine/threonine-protein kinase
MKATLTTAVLTSLITTAVAFFGLRALDARGMLPAASGAPPAGAPGGVEVPLVVGMRPAQARELLQGRGLLLSFSAERDSAQYPAGTIAEQTPLSGSHIAHGTEVRAILSRGVTEVPVPKVAGLKAAEASRQLAAAGLTAAGPDKIVASDTAPAGDAVDTEPPAGTLVAPKTHVTLVVSSGAAVKAVPKLFGLRLRAARELLEQQGFKAGKVRYDSDGDHTPGVVLAQKPAPPATAPPGTLIDLTINED